MDSLIYVSQATKDFDKQSIHKLASQAYLRNKKLLVTGFLNYYDGHFIQYLEGEKDPLSNLMNNIKADSRHTDLKIIYLPFKPERRFTTWHMRYLLLQEGATIGLGDLLADALLKIDDAAYSKAKVIGVIHRILDRLSNYYADFPHIPILISDEP
ncbi:MAG: BLUF domain-containing protein [Bacteroidota bacterium]